MMQKDNRLLAQCRALVEAKLNWGESERWTNADFEVLGEKILQETGVSLSTSTLKRLWGRVKYTSKPQAATLNALAKFVGYPSYRDLALAQKQEAKPDKVVSENSVETTPPQKLPAGKVPLRQRSFSKSTNWSIGLVMGFGLSLLIAFSLSQRQNETKLPGPRYAFSSRPVAKGIPNSVVFTFDVSQAPTDCLFVQQTWDKSKRFTIGKDQREATSIYYYPGFFTAKLTVDNTVVKQHKLLVKTDGWLPMVEKHPVPVYFKPEETTRDGVFGLSAAQLASRNIATQPEVPVVFYYYVDDFGVLSSDDFTLETSVKNTFSVGSGACQKTQVVVICEQGFFVIPLSIPGCTSALDVAIPGKIIRGSKADLSRLGVDFEDWAKMRLEAKDKRVEVLLNGTPVLRKTFSANAGKVVGIGYSFEGTGLVDYARLYNGNGEVVLGEEF